MTAEIPPGRLFATVPEFIEMTGYDRKTVVDAIERGEIPYIRVGQRRRIPMAWIREQARLEPGGWIHGGSGSAPIPPKKDEGE